jgi:flagellar motor switch protein FliM
MKGGCNVAAVLSQSEIDALLASLLGGSSSDSSNVVEEETTVSPNILEDAVKFTEENINALAHIHNEYINILNLSMFKNFKIKAALESIQEIRYHEFMNSLSYPKVLTVFKLNPLDGCLLLEASPSLISQLADISEDGILYGDRKCSLDLKDFSENDKNIFKKVTGDFIQYLEKAWSKVLSVKSEIEFLETDPTEVKLLDNNEAVVLISFSISICDTSDIFNICIPYSSVEKYLGTLEIKNTNFEIKQIGKFKNVDLEIKVIMNTIQLSLGEFMNIEKGEILNTHKRYKSKVSILVEEEHCFNGEVGLICNRKAVKILDCLEKDV